MGQVQQVLELLEDGNLKTALSTCQSAVNSNPADADAQHLLGLIYAKEGELYLAIKHFKIAINLAPHQSIYHNNISNAYKMLNDLESATRHLHEALQISPHNAESFNNLGSLYYTQGAITKAIPQFEKCIRLNPLSWEAHYNLANCYIKQDMVQQAISHYEQVLQLNAAHGNARLNLAMSYIMINDFAKALPLLELVAKHDPHNAELQGHLAECYLNLGMCDEALEQYIQAVNLDDSRPAWHHNLGVLYLRSGKSVKAREHFSASIKLQPENSTAQHMLAAIDNVPAQTAPPEYVKLLFDQYASYYNEHVKQSLNYAVPQLLRSAINRFIDHRTLAQYVLDLGCGTGLCGVYFRDLARFLVGVDLSPEMLSQAHALGAYDALCCADILSAIPGQNQHYFDLVLAADVFVYVGDLTQVFAMITSALKSGGRFAFTVEETPINDTWLLQSTGRFAHSQSYIHELSRQYSFNIDIDEAIVPRIQDNKPISGRLFVLTKP